MSENTDLPDNVVTPVSVADATADDESDGGVLPSPVEKKKDVLPEQLHRQYTVATDDHPLAVTAGSKEALQSDTPVKVQKILSDDLYQEEEVFFREQIQNHIAADVREAKRRVKNEYGERHLHDLVEHDHPELDETRTVALPKPAENILDAARELGYIPNIEVTVNHDENRIVTRDNGIGMTTSEVLDLWNQPAASGSGVDMTSAGKIGIGSLTWVTIAGMEGAVIVDTRTRRTETMSGQPVPPRDQNGFQFLAYFGGVLPLSGDVDDGFYGTRFEMPIRDDLNSEFFHQYMAKYAEILPIQVEWHEIGRSSELDDPEFNPDTFWSRFDSEPSIKIDRPGEFRIALDSPGVVPKGGSTNDTFLMDNPINRSTSYSQSIDTLWNEHIQILNEQGLIVAGPNRGKTTAMLDDLYGDLGDISDPDKPMPDVPLPQPKASRDGFQQDEAHRRFLEYVDHIAKEAEVEQIAEYVNGYLDTQSKDQMLRYLRERGTEFELYVKLAKQHDRTSTPGNRSYLYDWFDHTDAIDFDGSNAEERTDDHGEIKGMEKPTHPKWDHICLLAKLYRKSVSYATADTRGSPNKKENRKSDSLYEPLLMEDHWPIFVGATLNDHKVDIIHENYPDALVIKTRNYSQWQQSPFRARLVKETPLHRGEDEDDAWDIPDDYNRQHSPEMGDDGTPVTGYTPVPEDFEDRPVKIRHTENSAVDTRTTIGDLMSALDDKAWDDIIGDAGGSGKVRKKWLVVFDTTTDVKISDHYHLSKHVAIVKANHSESEALLQYDSAFSYEDYRAMVSSVEMETYNPKTGRTRKRTAKRLYDWDERTLVYVDDSNDRVIAALRGEDHEAVEGLDSAVRARLEERVTENFETKVNADEDEWLLVTRPADRLKRIRLLNYLNILKEEAHLGDFFTGYRTYNNRRVDNAIPDLEYQSTTRHSFEKIYDREPYPAWDNGSKVWERMNESYRGPNNREKAMYRALRDTLGIDPFDHDADELERVLGHMLEDCN